CRPRILRPRLRDLPRQHGRARHHRAALPRAAPSLYARAPHRGPKNPRRWTAAHSRAQPRFRAAARRSSRARRPRSAGGVSPILALERLGKIFRAGGHTVVALDNVSLTIERGTCHAVVGESGSGKTTLGNLVLGLFAPTTGTLRFNDDILPA